MKKRSNHFNICQHSVISLSDLNYVIFIITGQIETIRSILCSRILEYKITNKYINKRNLNLNINHNTTKIQ